MSSDPHSPLPDPTSLVFKMGEFEARFPTDRLYAKNHMWAQPQSGGAIRCGFAAYAVRLLQDVYFLEWDFDAGTPIQQRQKIGFIESSKAESELFSPLSGVLSTINDQLMSDPSAINTDKYGRGWIFEITGDPSPLLTPEKYIEHLESVWEVTQRTIKGQLNE